MERILRYFQLIVMLLVLVLPHDVAASLINDEEISDTGLVFAFDLFYDRTGDAKVEDILAGKLQARRDSAGVVLPQRERQGAYWIRFPSGTVKEPEQGCIFFAGQQRQTLLVVIGKDAGFRTYQPEAGRWKGSLFANDLLSFQLDTATDSIVLARIEPLRYFSNGIKPVVYPASGFDADKLVPDLTRFVYRYRWFHWLSYGAIAMMLAYILFKYLVLRSEEHLTYFGYLFCLLMTGVNDWISTTPAGVSYLEASHFFYVTLSLITYGSYLVFSSRLLNIRERMPGMHRMVRIMVSVIVLYAVLDNVFVYGFDLIDTMENCFSMFRLFLMIVSVVLIYKAYRMRDTVSAFFITGSSFYVLGGFVYVLFQYLHLHTSFDTQSLWTYPPFWYRSGAIAEILFFSMGLAYKTSQSERKRIFLENELAQEQQQHKSALDEARRLIVEEERNRVSRDLHDEVGMGLTRIRYLIETLKRKSPQVEAPEIDQITRESAQVIQTMHDIVWSLKTGEDSMQAFIANLRGTVVDYLETHGVELVFTVQGELERFDMSPVYKRNVLLVTRESLHNVVKHSRANKVEMSLNFSDRFYLRICDNGKRDVVLGRPGNGISNMRKRIEESEGRFEWSQLPYGGVCVSVELKNNSSTIIL